MKRPIHVLQVVHSLIVGGTERVVSDLVRAFNDGEFRTSVCCLDGLGELGEELRREGIKVHVLGRKPGLDLTLISRVRALYRQESVDLVHAHQYTPYFYSATAALSAGLTPVIFTEHGRHWPDYLRMKRAVVNQFLRLTTGAYTAVSEFSRQSLIRYEKIPAKAIQVIYNGIKRDAMSAHVNDRRRIRCEVGLEDEAVLVLSIGRLDRIKDFATLIRAFSLIAKRSPNVRLWIAGDGDPAYKTELAELISQLDLQRQARLLGTRRDVDRLLAASDLFALSSISEASAMTILEAMAAGRAVVATRTGGNAELVVQGETGILVPVGNISAMAEAMVRLLNDPNQRARMSENGREKVKKDFSWDLSVAQYRNLYRSVSGKKQRSPRRV